jgi:transcriptional regulator
MNSKEKLYRVIYLALLEIRADANISSDKKTFEISNLIHNLPLKLLKSDGENYDEILSDLIESGSNNKGLSSWLKNNSIDS